MLLDAVFAQNINIPQSVPLDNKTPSNNLKVRSPTKIYIQARTACRKRTGIGIRVRPVRYP